MIEIGGIILIIGAILIAISFNYNKLGETLFIIGTILMTTGLILIIIFFVITGQCHNECSDRGLIYDSQEYNQCSEELTCYCKQPITKPKNKSGDNRMMSCELKNCPKCGLVYIDVYIDMVCKLCNVKLEYLGVLENE